MTFPSPLALEALEAPEVRGDMPARLNSCIKPLRTAEATQALDQSRPLVVELVVRIVMALSAVRLVVTHTTATLREVR
jgi:hypothetical protein